MVTLGQIVGQSPVGLQQPVKPFLEAEQRLHAQQQLIRLKRAEQHGIHLGEGVAGEGAGHSPIDDQQHRQKPPGVIIVEAVAGREQATAGSIGHEHKQIGLLEIDLGGDVSAAPGRDDRVLRGSQHRAQVTGARVVVTRNHDSCRCPAGEQ